ncbi:mavicyanin [Arachis duranensis]|uniref:Mavicyanin n=1 Tax=Arachis duranensis TaxID=130453 RepID=A0A6P4BA55_ARADU|nr:mavicyanin [Arachis duranensis]
MAKAIALVGSSFLILLLASQTVFATDYTVGDASGWTNFGVDYKTWASGKTFKVGDTLTFNYDTSTHQVAEVSESDYGSCSSSNAIKTYSDGKTKITLSKAGSYYFLCPTAGHCSSGMKLQVTASGSSGGSPPSSGSSSKSPSGSPSTPSTTPATPSSPAPKDNAAVGVSSGVTQFIGALLASALVLGFVF